MPFPRRPEGALDQAVHERLHHRDCPLCGERAWDFEGARVVLVVPTNYPDDVKRSRSRTGTPIGPATGSEEEHAIAVFKHASRDNGLVQIACNNCGHTELLDRHKLLR
jgi:hypothetical protein